MNAGRCHCCLLDDRDWRSQWRSALTSLYSQLSRCADITSYSQSGRTGPWYHPQCWHIRRKTSGLEEKTGPCVHLVLKNHQSWDRDWVMISPAVLAYQTGDFWSWEEDWTLCASGTENHQSWDRDWVMISPAVLTSDGRLLVLRRRLDPVCIWYWKTTSPEIGAGSWYLPVLECGLCRPRRTRRRIRFHQSLVAVMFRIQMFWSIFSAIYVSIVWPDRRKTTHWTQTAGRRFKRTHYLRNERISRLKYKHKMLCALDSFGCWTHLKSPHMLSCHMEGRNVYREMGKN